MTQISLVQTTVATCDEAQRLARAMVEIRLAACAQIGAIDSVYRWQGAVQADGEWRVLFKTTPGRSAALQAALRQRHPYALPAIVAWTAEASDDIAAWVAAETAD